MSKFNKHKRLEAAIAGEPVDRLPVALWRHWPGDDQDAQALAEAHITWQQMYDWDFVKVSPSSSYAIQDLGVKSVWEGHMEGTRTYTQRVVTDPAGWSNLPVLDPSEGMLAVQIEALRLIGEAFQEETPFLTTIFSPLSQAKNISGGEAMLSHLRQNPAAFQEGMKTITESTLRFIDAAIKTGISGIYYAIQHNRYHLMSPAEYQIFGQPYDEEILGFANDLMMNVVHVHGPDAYLDIVADYPVEVVNWHDRETPAGLAEGLQQICGAASGGVSRDTMLQESPEAALAEAVDAVKQTEGKRFILGTGCVIMVTTPTRNIRALREFVDNT